jgi:hypothetical protein
LSRARAHASKYGPLYAALALLGSGAGATQFDVARRAVCGPPATELLAQASKGYEVAVSAYTAQIAGKEADLLVCKKKRRCP